MNLFDNKFSSSIFKTPANTEANKGLFEPSNFVSCEFALGPVYIEGV